MKHQSESFNKQSRLIVAPQVAPGHGRRLPAADGATLKARLVDALQAQQDFFPCFDWVFPPPVFTKAPGPRRAEELFDTASVVPGTYSVYVHVPFCRSLCSFCYYPVLIGRGSDEKATYVDYLLREMALYRAALRGMRCESVYIGGGTPTALDDEQLRRLLAGIRANFDLRSDAEISIESAPGTLGAERVALLRSLGVTRLSYGMQSLDERLLAAMNRHYRVEGAIAELREALPIIGNINVDTMYGFDGEPADALLRTLETFERIGIPSLTVYALDNQRSVRKVMWLGPPRDDLYFRKIDTYREARQWLESRGYRRLFQNTFARAEAAPYRHQLRRWENVPLVGLGIGSMGYAPRAPYRNLGTREAWFRRLDAGELPIESVERLDPEMEMARQVTTQLRFARVDLRQVRERYGVDLEAAFGDLLRVLGELGFVERHGDELCLSEAAAPYTNVLPMLFAPDSFKEALLGLPEEYLETMPTPRTLTRVGATQSASTGLCAARGTGEPRSSLLHACSRR